MALDGPNIMSLGGEPSVERTGKGNRRMSAAIAESLSAEALPEKPSRRHSNQPSKASQEEMQRKIDILMSSPKLWQEFKHYLAESGSMSRLGTQEALREFLEKNEEIAAEDAAAQVRQSKQASGMGRKIMGAVTSLTSELGEEEDAPCNQSSPTKSPPKHAPSTARSSSSSASSRAASMGMGLLRRAGEAASSSLGGLNKEAEASVEEKTNFNGHNSRPALVGVVNSWIQGSARSLKVEIDMDEMEEEEEEIESDEEKSLGNFGKEFEVPMEEKGDNSSLDFLEAVSGWLQGSKSSLKSEIDMDEILKEEEIESKEKKSLGDFGKEAEVSIEEKTNLKGHNSKSGLMEAVSSLLERSTLRLKAEIDVDEIKKEE